jgi:hypothetical protein
MTQNFWRCPTQRPYVLGNNRRGWEIIKTMCRGFRCPPNHGACLLAILDGREQARRCRVSEDAGRARHIARLDSSLRKQLGDEHFSFGQAFWRSESGEDDLGKKEEECGAGMYILGPGTATPSVLGLLILAAIFRDCETCREESKQVII